MARKFKGVVVSNKMDKTAVVRVDRLKTHPIYKKRFKVSKNFKIHDAENILKPGDLVEFEETKPISKDKKWVLTNVVKGAHFDQVAVEPTQGE
ncbi:TPA: 30S ribosomal protein S17 [candidate division CPR2 bacterium]|uniref:Small ribosomal subunit protein uS17 n=1 Tax=candidate division CPR2 bacterium GW2011_GWC1_41_48 TaxID=1618344 RepID=A0A0G0YH19_UNCC2|nr:MAG: 30S ribosomal protein S17 [candidate division CPR2 bacterium GW2011_GWC2_39_35]KKR27160.1 MAG: 30S ribosomal protein S17 [candidate division CPR2 bacterium GW2011_GWD2_39_7]KKR27395.1 MAG: 30S ribosomal protein S17 [candidate division CPR2 bacterium GW2011_GWD1_39_7]KKS08846.1 MAG: 30S ribosomal protein S17, small subunit ribosomal protein S17 [candidate division CPR2 bacterium GW2011_GWC1_41_48]OGB58568.1 MAG: 30S ribosomal protein S17 [candidate division CPR2 bacterium GWD1_39_7]OGB7